MCKESYFPWNKTNLPTFLSEIFHKSSESNLPILEVTVLVENMVLKSGFWVRESWVNPDSF